MSRVAVAASDTERVGPLAPRLAAKKEVSVMSNKLYVGNLSFDTNEEGLKDYFSQAGQVDSCSIIMDKFTQRSRGFGFVEMGTPEEAQEAIKALDGKELDGRSLRVNIAKPREERPPRDNYR